MWTDMYLQTVHCFLFINPVFSLKNISIFNTSFWAFRNFRNRAWNGRTSRLIIQQVVLLNLETNSWNQFTYSQLEKKETWKMMKKLRSRFSISVAWKVLCPLGNQQFRTINEWAVGFHTWRPRLLVTIWIQFMKIRTLRIRTAQKGNWIKLAVIYHKNFSSQNDRDLNDPLKKLVHHVCVREIWGP